MAGVKILVLEWMISDKTSLLNFVIEYEDTTTRLEMELDYHSLIFSYVYKVKHQPLVIDNDLMEQSRGGNVWANVMGECLGK